MGTPPRPMPDDFASFANTHSRREVEQHYKCGNLTATRWYTESGVQTPRAQVAKIPVTDITKVRTLVAKGMTATDIGLLYSASKRATLGFVERHNLGPWPIIRTRPLPDDFQDIAPTLARDAAKLRWGCSNDTLARWYAETGIVPAKRASTRINATPERIAKIVGMNIKQAAEKLGIDRKAASRIMREAGLVRDTPRETKPRVRTIGKKALALPNKQMGAPFQPVDHYQRDMSPEGLAVDALQRDRWSVFRCDADGKPSVGGQYWIVGKAGPVDKAELMERADRAARRMGEAPIWRQERWGIGMAA